MTKYILRRVAEMFLTVFIIATATFFLLNAVPGDPFTELLQRFPPEAKAEIYHKYGYDQPVYIRYGKTMKQMLKGDFGVSIAFPGQTMSDIIKAKLPASARLGLQQMIFGVTLGLVLGVVAALNRGKWPDYLIVTVAILFTSIPHLVFALLLQKYFAGTLHWFPIIGWPKGDKLWFGGWKYTILPTLSGCFGYIAGYARLVKTTMLDTINQDFILTAKAKGLSKKTITWKHIFRNSLIPLVTVLPMTVANCITGSLFIERVFSIPGLGQYFVKAINGRDLTVILGETVLLTIIYVVVVLFTDLLYTVADPRIRITGGQK